MEITLSESALLHSRIRIPGPVNYRIAIPQIGISVDVCSSVGTTVRFNIDKTYCTFNHEVLEGDNRILLVGLANGGSTDSWVTNMTFNSVSMTKIDRIVNTDNYRMSCELWYLLNPDVGEYSVEFNLSDIDTSGAAGAFCFKNVDQDTPFSNIVKDSSGVIANPFGLTIPTNNDNIAFGVAGHGGWIVGNQTNQETCYVESRAGNTWEQCVNGAYKKGSYLYPSNTYLEWEITEEQFDSWVGIGIELCSLSWESEMIVDTKFVTNHMDDVTTPNVTYVGQEDKTGIWKLIKIDETGATPVFTYASITNNPTLTTYALAWAGRVLATYSEYSNAF